MTTIAHLRRLARRKDSTAIVAEDPGTTAGGQQGTVTGRPGLAGSASDAGRRVGPPLTQAWDARACRDLAADYLEAFRSTHPYTNPPSVIVLPDGGLLFNGFVLSAEDMAEMRANLLRWHQPPVRHPRDN